MVLASLVVTALTGVLLRATPEVDLVVVGGFLHLIRQGPGKRRQDYRMEIKFDEAGISGGAGVDAVAGRSKPVLAQLAVSSPYPFTGFISYVLYALPAFFGPANPSKPSAWPTRRLFAPK